jgi:hypothetical protein
MALLRGVVGRNTVFVQRVRRVAPRVDDARCDQTADRD